MPNTPLAGSVTVDLTRDLTATSGTTMQIRQPYTGDPLHDLPRSTADDVRAAAGAAKRLCARLKPPQWVSRPRRGNRATG